MIKALYSTSFYRFQFIKKKLFFSFFRMNTLMKTSRLTVTFIIVINKFSLNNFQTQSQLTIL